MSTAWILVADRAKTQLIVPPQFPGAFNAALGEEMHACVAAELRGDLASADMQEVHSHLPRIFGNEPPQRVNDRNHASHSGR